MAEIVRLPCCDGVTVTEHDPLRRVQDPPGVIDTVPLGVVEPCPEESVTVAVQLVAWLTTTLLGAQVSDVEVVRSVTPRPNA